MALGHGRRIRRLAVDAAVGKTVTFPTTVWLSLHTANPGDDGQTSGEVTTTTSGYARQQVTAANWTAAPNPTNDNPAVSASAVSVTFGPSSGVNASWGTITHVGLWDSSSATAEANYIGRAAVTPNQVVNGTGQSVSFAIGAITMTDNSS